MLYFQKIVWHIVKHSYSICLAIALVLEVLMLRRLYIPLLRTPSPRTWGVRSQTCQGLIFAHPCLNFCGHLELYFSSRMRPSHPRAKAFCISITILSGLADGNDHSKSRWWQSQFMSTGLIEFACIKSSYEGCLSAAGFRQKQAKPSLNECLWRMLLMIQKSITAKAWTL